MKLLRFEQFVNESKESDEAGEKILELFKKKFENKKKMKYEDVAKKIASDLDMEEDDVLEFLKKHEEVELEDETSEEEEEEKEKVDEEEEKEKVDEEEDEEEEEEEEEEEVEVSEKKKKKK